MREPLPHPTITDTAAWQVVIAGAGLMGRWHGAALRQIGATIVAVADPDPTRRSQLARRTRAVGVGSLAEGLASGQIDAVHVCTPLDTHASLVREGLQHGCHVLVEKPLAPTVAVTEELLSLATSRGRILCPVHQFLYQRGVQATLRALPRLGKIRHIDYVACTAGADSGDESTRRAVALEILPHPLSLATRFLGRPLAAAQWSVHEPAAGELRAASLLDGVALSILISTRGRPTRNTMRIIAERGTVHLDLFHGFAVVEEPVVSRSRKIFRPLILSTATMSHWGTNLLRRVAGGEPAYPGLRELVRRFAAAGRAGTAPPITADEVMDIATTIERISSR